MIGTMKNFIFLLNRLYKNNRKYNKQWCKNDIGDDIE